MEGVLSSGYELYGSLLNKPPVQRLCQLTVSWFLFYTPVETRNASLVMKKNSTGSNTPAAQNNGNTVSGNGSLKLEGNANTPLLINGNLTVSRLYIRRQVIQQSGVLTVAGA